MKNLIAFIPIALFSTISLMAQNDKLTKSINEYSFDLYSSMKDDKNLFISPLSTYSALLMAYEGSAGETKMEFENVLHISNPAMLSDYSTFSNNLISKKEKGPQLNISNAIWIQKGFDIESNFQDRVVNQYSSELKPINFRKSKPAAKEINNWVNDNTKGLIHEIVSPSELNRQTRLVISNAIYFEGKWAKEFDKEMTKVDKFYSIQKEEYNVDFMNKSERLKYFENEDFQFISKPYEGKDKSMCIILPKEKYGLTNIEEKLSGSLFDLVLTKAFFSEVKLSIPKFKMATDYSLVSPLKSLGLNKAFSRSADFSGITSMEALMISQINHKAYFEIDEEKTKASAATAIAITTTAFLGSTPKFFKADHPFVFMIIDNKTKAILFIGRYTQP